MPIYTGDITANTVTTNLSYGNQSIDRNNLALWLNADSGNYSVAANTYVTSVLDQSGNAYHSDSLVGSGFMTIATRNSRNVFRCNPQSVNTALKRTTSNVVGTAAMPALTQIVVASAFHQTDDCPFALGNSCGGTARAVIDVAAYGCGIASEWDAGSVGGYFSTTAGFTRNVDTNLQIYVVEWIPISSGASQTLRRYVYNRTSRKVVACSLPTTTFMSLYTSPVGWTLGNWGNNDRPFAGTTSNPPSINKDIAEVLVYNTILDESRRNSIIQILVNKWGI